MEKQTTELREVEIFKSLGLTKQVSLREVQTVMDGMPYYPVTMKDLNGLFGMGWIKFLTAIHNEKLRSSAHPVMSFFMWALISLPAVLLSICSHFSASTEGHIWPLMMFSIFSLFSIILMVERDVRGVLEAEISIESIRSTSIKIPYGAALRYQEALEKKVFDEFIVAYPNVIEKQISRDPAILGIKNVNGERRMFMVVYWDIEKDKARVIRKIKDYKQFKV